MITHTNLFADASNWIFYLAYLFSHMDECSSLNQQSLENVSHGVRTMSLLAFQEASEYRFYHTDTLFALVIWVGIKVVDLLTPYKCGGKIDLFGGAGVGKTVLIMEFI